MYFEDRKEAGQKLGVALVKRFPFLRGAARALVLALPRGGVPVGYEIAHALKIALDLILTHKLGAPGNEEFAIGAVAEDSSTWLDPDSIHGISKDYITSEIQHQLEEIKTRIEKYRGGKALPELTGKTVILADDGIATGNTMKAAIALAKNAKAAKVIVAVPVLPKDTLKSLAKLAEVVFLDTPWPFLAIGRFYQNFPQLTDAEVRSYLEEAKR